MKIIALILIAMVAVEHLLFLWLEMFAWESTGKKVFRGALAPELFKPTKVLAANQGLYNGFLAAGLVWPLFISNPQWQLNVGMFFLSCVVIAGIYGAYSASRRILYVQAFPALLAMLFLILSQNN